MCAGGGGGGGSGGGGGEGKGGSVASVPHETEMCSGREPCSAQLKDSQQGQRCCTSTSVTVVAE